jgi:penicillin-binding protein 2
VSWVHGVANHLWANWRSQRETLLNEPVPLEAVAAPIREQQISHAIINEIEPNAMSQVLAFIAEAENEPAQAVWQQVSIEPSNRRVYPMEQMTVTVNRSTFPGPLKSDTPATVTVQGVGLHMLGSMRQIWREDVEGPEGRPFSRKNERDESIIDLGGYLPGDMTGRWGIERAQEWRLRGLRGQRIEQLDSHTEQRIDPKPGRDVRLTIDIELQARITALLSPDLGLMIRQPWHEKELVGPVGEPLCGAAVVLDIASGEVLAAVSAPTFSSELLRTDPDAIWKDQRNRPGINRPVGMPYEPGSTLKALVLTAAVTAGEYHLHENIPCTGYLNPPGNPQRYQCWIHKQYSRTHGDDMAGDRAICESCNIFFYTLGRRLGARQLVQWYRRFGLGELTYCGLPDERRGDLPDLSGPTGPRDPGFTDADAVLMGIGQGPVRWTPVQAASAYATLARGGRVIPPAFLIEGDDAPDRPEPHDLKLDPRGVAMTLKGLHDAVTTRAGTGHHVNFGESSENTFNIENVTLYGKSGTADAAALRQAIDDNGDGLPDRWGQVLRDGDHAWLIALVQRPGSARPDYVVVVVVEYAGSGGRVAGPIVNQILYAMRAQGYL